MKPIRTPSRGWGHPASPAAAFGLLTAAVLALTGCSSNTPTAAGATVTVPTVSTVPTTVTATVATSGPTGMTSPTTAGGTSAPTGGSSNGGTLPPLPDRLDGLQTLDAAATASGGDRAKSTVEVNARRKQLTEKAYSDAYGTPALVQTYASDDLMFLPTVIVVGAPSPGLTIGPVGDPADLGLAVNLTTVVTDGQVKCVVNAGQAVPSGQQPDPEKAITSQCQRTGPAMTVLVFGTGNGTAGHRQMVDLTDAAWTAAGGG